MQRNFCKLAISATFAIAALAVTPASAQQIDWDAQFEACANEKTGVEVQKCRRRIMHHVRVDEAFNEKQDDVIINIDANDQNDGNAEKAAKQEFYDALDECLDHKKQVIIQQCRRDATRAYGEKISG